MLGVHFGQEGHVGDLEANGDAEVCRTDMVEVMCDADGIHCVIQTRRVD